MYPVLILAFSAGIAAIITAIITLLSGPKPEGKEFAKKLLFSGIGMLIVSGLFLLLKMY